MLRSTPYARWRLRSTSRRAERTYEQLISRKTAHLGPHNADLLPDYTRRIGAGIAHLSNLDLTPEELETQLREIKRRLDVAYIICIWPRIHLAGAERCDGDGIL